jgi:hypothetical protein
LYLARATARPNNSGVVDVDQKERKSGIGARGIAALAIVAASLVLASIADAKGPVCKPNSKSWRCSGDLTSPGNSAPTISGTPATSVISGQTYSFTPTASDPDGDTLSFSIVNRPPWASFSSSTGRLAGTPTSSSVGEYIDIRISVSDGQATASLAPFSIVVKQANRAPTISGTPPTTAREGQAYAFTPTASDADGDTLTFSIANRPSWASFNNATGALTGTPAAGTVGSYSNITIKVSDGTTTVSLPAFSIEVQQASSGSATLTWEPPTTRTDGTPLTNLAGYRIRYGTSSGSYPNVITIANGGITSAVVENLPPATYYFVATAYDTTGAESSYSSTVSKTIK